MRKKNLGFFTSYDYSYSDVKRSVNGYPKLTSIDPESGSFSTEGFEETVEFRRQASNEDEWHDGNSVSRFYINRSLKIKGNDVNIKFENNTYQEQYY